MLLNPRPAYVLKTSTLGGVRTKVFLNICADRQIPAPDTLSAAEIRARDGQLDITIAVSPERQDTDKAGAPCLVFDCCVHPGVVRLALKDNMRISIEETLLVLVEFVSRRRFSRNYFLPRMAAKGTLAQLEIADGELQSGTQSLAGALENVTLRESPRGDTAAAEPSDRADRGGRPEARLTVKAIVGIRPLIHEFWSPDSEPKLQAVYYRRPWAGEGAAPQYEVPVPGWVRNVETAGAELRIDDKVIVLPSPPARTRAIYTQDDHKTHVFIW